MLFRSWSFWGEGGEWKDEEKIRETVVRRMKEKVLREGKEIDTSKKRGSAVT